MGRLPVQFVIFDPDEVLANHSYDPLVDEHAAHHLVESCRANWVFTAKSLDLPANGFCESFRISFGAHIEDAFWKRLRFLKVREINDGRRSFAEVEQLCIVSDAHDLKILVVGHEAVTNVLSNGLAVDEKALREAPTYNSETRVVGVIDF